MNSFLDSSFIIRYLTGAPRDAALRASFVIDSADQLEVTEGTLSECAYVLEKLYGLPREIATDSLIKLVTRDNIRVHGLDKALVIQALALCRPSKRVSFADALLWSVVRQAGNGVIYTFDRRFPSAEVEIRRE